MVACVSDATLVFLVLLALVVGIAVGMTVGCAVIDLARRSS